jgi:UPF0755 protein
MSRWLKLASGVVIAFILLLAAAIAVISSQFQPVSSTPQPKVKFVIPKGQAVSVIASNLQEAGLIRHPLALRAELRRKGLEDKIQAGSFDLSPSMSLSEIAQTLTTGTNDVWVTLLEGWRREEIADSLDRQELPAFDKEKFLELSASSEGTLFPDTYLVPREATAEQLYSLFTNTFDRKVTQGLADEIKASDHDWNDVLIMASIVEREARGLTQMKEVAGILWHRLEIGMPLQADATLQYAKGYDKKESAWWVPPLGADRQLDSPFNTYQHPGLPPRPIANPGLDALTATLQPNQTNNLFYIHDSDGKLHYAQTLEEHNRNIERYLR